MEENRIEKRAGFRHCKSFGIANSVNYRHTFPTLMISRLLPIASLLATLAFAHAAPEAFEVGPAQKDQLPGGKEADGIIGDFILRNDRVEAVISGNLPLRRANMSTFYGNDGITPGCVYDLTLRGTNNDQLTYFGPAAQQGSVSWVRVLKDGRDGEAVIETVVTGAHRGGVARYHRYTLREGWPGLQITTTIINESAEGKKLDLAGRLTTAVRTGIVQGINWADAIDPADKAGYAYGNLVAPENYGTGKDYALAAGASVTVVRFLAVGRSPVEALGEVVRQRGQPIGEVRGVVRDGQGAPVPTAQVLVRTAAPRDENVGVAHPDSQGRLAFVLPEGKYVATFTDAGRAEVVQDLEVKAGAPAKLDATLAAAAAIQFRITDAAGRSIPCKAQFLAQGETEPANLGPQNRAHGCVDQYHSEKGDFRVALPPGRYRVIVTRGIEHSHLAREVVLAEGQTFEFTGTLQRLVDTTGWVSADYHNHSTPSGDNTCGTHDRLINLAAEHIEFAPTTEHNRLFDWAPHIEKLGLSADLQTVPGLELTGRYAHFNAFPFQPEPRTQDNGAPVWNDDPRITAITLRDWQGADADRWVQINHPDMVKNFTDANSDGRLDGGFRGLATLIDGIETQNYSASSILSGRPFKIGKTKEGKDSVEMQREFIWLQMLNRGHRYAAMAVNDAHSVYGNGVGGWRMYLPSASDQPAEIDWRENSRHAKAGHSYLTTGPYLQVLTDSGTGPGNTSRAVGKSVKLNVHVQCTDWIDIDRVQVLVNGRARPELNFTRAAHPQMFRDGVVKFDQTIKVPLSEDAHVIVVATGEHSDLSIGYGTSTQAKIKPIAYHNPIFIDLDGHGFTPNGDTLGYPLPVAKMSVEEARQVLGGAQPAAVKPAP
jgi:hypothetical protein